MIAFQLILLTIVQSVYCSITVHPNAYNGSVFNGTATQRINNTHISTWASPQTLSVHLLKFHWTGHKDCSPLGRLVVPLNNVSARIGVTLTVSALLDPHVEDCLQNAPQCGVQHRNMTGINMSLHLDVELSTDIVFVFLLRTVVYDNVTLHVTSPPSLIIQCDKSDKSSIITMQLVSSFLSITIVVLICFLVFRVYRVSR